MAEHLDYSRDAVLFHEVVYRSAQTMLPQGLSPPLLIGVSQSADMNS